MIDNTIGRNIRSLRIQNNMTQEQLAGRLHITRQTLSNYERGIRIPDIYELISIANILCTTIDDIAGRV